MEVQNSTDLQDKDETCRFCLLRHIHRSRYHTEVKESVAKQEGIPSDSVEISEEGKHIANIEGEISSNPIDNTQDVTYSKSGEAVDVVQTGEAVNISI